MYPTSVFSHTKKFVEKQSNIQLDFSNCKGLGNVIDFQENRIFKF